MPRARAGGGKQCCGQKKHLRKNTYFPHLECFGDKIFHIRKTDRGRKLPHVEPLETGIFQMWVTPGPKSSHLWKMPGGEYVPHLENFGCEISHTWTMSGLIYPTVVENFGANRFHLRNRRGPMFLHVVNFGAQNCSHRNDCVVIGAG